MAIWVTIRLGLVLASMTTGPFSRHGFLPQRNRLPADLHAGQRVAGNLPGDAGAGGIAKRHGRAQGAAGEIDAGHGISLGGVVDGKLAEADPERCLRNLDVAV
ncbi:MAG TPA: hypothetical protein VIR45_05565 [Kiloniellaceae bacterium]